MSKNSILEKKKYRTKSSRADLIFPVGRITRYLRRGSYAKHIGATASVYLAGVLEYLVAEVIELSGNAAKADKKSRIRPRDINLAVLQDEELSKLLQSVTISNGGVLPKLLLI